MSYKEQVDRVIAFIGKHLDEELELDKLCRIACFSKYHFHRYFDYEVAETESLTEIWVLLK